MVAISQLVDAVEDGAQTRNEIADAVDRHPGNVGKYLRQAVDEGKLAREKSAEDGYTYVYKIPAHASEGSASPAAAEGDEDVGNSARPYVFGPHQADHEYVPSADEWVEINALISSREVMGTLPRIMVSGPSGNGKTTLAENIAQEWGAHFEEIAMSNAIYESDLVGGDEPAGQGMQHVDGPVAKALAASAPPEQQVAEGWVDSREDAHEGPAVLLIDEVNRASPETLNVLFPALDGRCRVNLKGSRNGQTVQGDPQNLIVVGTLNEGTEHHGTFEMDHALERRFKFKFETDYIGQHSPEDEAGLIAQRTPVHPDLASLMVEAANEVRELAAEPNSAAGAGGKVKTGLPTSALIDWAGGAFGFHDDGLDDPVDRAAEHIVRLFYGDPGADGAADVVLTEMQAKCSGAPIDPTEFDSWSGEGGAEPAAGDTFECRDCSWGPVGYEDVPDQVLDYNQCPECGEPVEWNRN